MGKHIDIVMEEAKQIAPFITDYDSFLQHKEQLIDIVDRALDADARDQGYDSFSDMYCQKAMQEWVANHKPSISIEEIRLHIQEMGQFPILKPIMEVKYDK